MRAIPYYLLECLLCQVDQGFMVSGFKVDVRNLAESVVPDHVNIISLADGGDGAVLAIPESTVYFLL